MKLILIALMISIIQLTGCSSDKPKESDELLSNYKKDKMEKVKKVEKKLNERSKELQKQLDTINNNKKKDPR